MAIIGIDLGTSNSAAAVLRGGGPSSSQARKA
jgi:molecular chaperone DnaK (HSP70)